MKRLFTASAFLIIGISIAAQVPGLFKYQAVVRDNAGNPIAGQDVGFRIDILKGSVDGSSVYAETHSVTTSMHGLVNLTIGAGTSADDLSAINWGDDEYFIQVSLDAAGGTDYELVGTSQLLSVPYALHAGTADSVTGHDLGTLATREALEDSSSAIRADIPDVGGFLSMEADPVFGGSVAAGISTEDTTRWGNKLDSYDETQGLSDVLDRNNNADSIQIKNLADPTDARDAVTKSYVTMRVSVMGDSLFLGNDQFVIIPGISASNSPYDSISDIDGNSYRTVALGNQVWMADNFRATRYADGAPILKVTEDAEWSFLTTPAYSWYHNDSVTNSRLYGALYNWYVVEHGNLCPGGWHISLDEDWTILVNYLGGHLVAGGKLKEAGYSHWESPNLGATNETYFTALPGGSRDGEFGFFADQGQFGTWWGAGSPGDTDNAYTRVMQFHTRIVDRYGLTTDQKSRGYSVRCVKDAP